MISVRAGILPWQKLRDLGGELLAEPSESVLREEDGLRGPALITAPNSRHRRGESYAVRAKRRSKA
jgi:hypothetical protein